MILLIKAVHDNIGQLTTSEQDFMTSYGAGIVIGIAAMLLMLFISCLMTSIRSKRFKAEIEKYGRLFGDIFVYYDE